MRDSSKALLIGSGLTALAGLGFVAWNAQKSEPAKELDRGIPKDTATATMNALEVETDPAKLTAFGNALLPDYPIASALVLAKARFLDASRKLASASTSGPARPVRLPRNVSQQLQRLPPKAQKGLGAAAAHVLSNETAFPSYSKLLIADLIREGKVRQQASIRGVYYPDVYIGGWFDSFTKAVSKVADVATSAVSKAADVATSVVDKTTDAATSVLTAPTRGLRAVAHDIPGVDTLTHALEAPIELAAKTTRVATSAAARTADTAAQVLNPFSGKSVRDRLRQVEKVTSDIADDVKPLAQATLPFVSMVPGVGPVAAFALATGIALAAGEPITDAMISGAAGMVPGGALVQNAVKAGATAAVDMAKGKSLKDTLFDTGRAALPDNAYVKAAYDTGAALAYGKSLQEAGFKGALGLAKGAGLGDKVGEFVKLGPDATKILESQAVKDLGKVVGKAEDLTKAVGQIVKNPGLSVLGSEALAKQLGVAEPLARAALGSIEPMAPFVQHIGRPLDQVQAAMKNAPVVVNADRLKKFQSALDASARISALVPSKGAPSPGALSRTVSPARVTAVLKPGVLKVLSPAPSPERIKWVRYYLHRKVA